MKRNWLMAHGMLAGGALLLGAFAGCSGSASDDDDAAASPTPTSPPSSPTPTAVPATPTPASPTPASPTPFPATPTVAPGEGCDYTLGPSADDYTHVQTVFITAPAGSTICLAEGKYSFNRALSISTGQIVLKGLGDAEKVLLDFKTASSGANALEITGNDVTMQDMTVLNPPGDGVRATAVQNITFLNVSVLWENGPNSANGGYGLYPVQSQHVIIESCTVSGASDTGVYVGQSSDILVRSNDVYGNVAGIEIENSTDAEVVDNHAHDNAAGILVFNLPGLEVEGGQRSNVHDNLIEHNNLANFAPEGNIVGLVPQGTGMFVLSSDNNEFHNNIVQENESVGIAIVAYSELLVGSAPPEGFDAYPEGNFVHDNILIDNGTDPQDVARQLMLAVKVKPPLPGLIWDGCTAPGNDGSDEALTNCFFGNLDGKSEPATYGNMELCNDFPNNYTYDMTEVTCEHDPLPHQY